MTHRVPPVAALALCASLAPLTGEAIARCGDVRRGHGQPGRRPAGGRRGQIASGFFPPRVAERVKAAAGR